MHKCCSRKACRRLVSASQRSAETSVFLLLLCGWSRSNPKGMFWCLPLLTSPAQLPPRCQSTLGSPRTESTRSVWQPLHGQIGTFPNASSSPLRGQGEVGLGCPQKQQVLQMPLDSWIYDHPLQAHAGVPTTPPLCKMLLAPGAEKFV